MSRIVGCGFHFSGPSSGQTRFVSVCAKAAPASAIDAPKVSVKRVRDTMVGMRDARLEQRRQKVSPRWRASKTHLIWYGSTEQTVVPGAGADGSQFFAAG